jgi:hypothetical protein
MNITKKTDNPGEVTIQKDRQGKPGTDYMFQLPPSWRRKVENSADVPVLEFSR